MVVKAADVVAKAVVVVAAEVIAVEFWGSTVVTCGNDVFAGEMVVWAFVEVRIWLGVVNDGTG